MTRREAIGAVAGLSLPAAVESAVPVKDGVRSLIFLIRDNVIVEDGDLETFAASLRKQMDARGLRGVPFMFAWGVDVVPVY